ncbi:uncharacterized protein LOC110931284 [Helianthus annuus]|uniref:uncharacterized protein LOC110931284 n=1 Tax=Helianthus annuus TaxID=4232 RepID=UPI000B9095A4|nr:uncharacterized protein LOC110931284 [Helianthus annuus]
MDTEVIDPKADSTNLSNVISGSDQMCSTELLGTSIQDVRNKKKALTLTIQSVWRLMQQVECEEKAAEKAKDEADFLLKMDALNQELLEAEETKNMLLRKVHGEKDGLAITMESLYRRVGHKLDVGDKSLDDLNEMRNALQTCLTTAISNKEYANKKKQEKEAALVCKEIHIKKAVDEINRIKQEALENSKMQELLNHHDHVTSVLNGEISDLYESVKMLKLSRDFWSVENFQVVTKKM